LIIENATGCPPRGLLDKSYTVAVKVEEPVVVPTLAGTIVGDAWSTILAGAAPEDIATVKVS
jgi:mannose/fructose/N-acetylgalactosamine-specific phosphotransferase system component IIC